ncbi:MAG: S-adenosyl-L-methionine (SAM)-dependent methyltransferase [Candidatus Magnetoglobus multicellularis str. Araruama]|uniref:S-adenosyl-L-methionine (SAM)-dependent methyltransferase n=1 Tax=Candidatus Magnetoglobus multicellularis str. Araruama TaxID=890399 RepID=A0A1V1NY04_9BACT|nr:MAG: S-adenosyl-L-methionine (SAM)-dependent methyltransferase [Candidatus Magnetoglobus multicellularis str. Araruama]
MKYVLNVGGNSRKISLPSQYNEFEHVLLDIDPKGSPDILCDARELLTFKADQFDAVYCSHNLEHYHHHDIHKVLEGFLHVLKAGGFAHIRVPDIMAVMRTTIEKGLDIEDVLYNSPAGPIMILDVLYGYDAEIEKKGKDYYAHKTGFSRESLLKALDKSGFSKIFSNTGIYEINALAFKGVPEPAFLALFNIHD